MNEEEHLFDWYLKKTEKIRVRDRLKKRTYKKNKFSLDNTIYFCDNCQQVWAYVPHYVDFRKKVMYPKGNIPTIGKKRKKCDDCKKFKRRLK